MTPNTRGRRTILLSTALVVIIALTVMYLLADLLLIFGLSAVAASILLPLVKLLGRAMPWRERMPALSRTIALATIFIAGIGSITVALIVLVPPAVEETGHFISSFPLLLRQARTSLEQWLRGYADIIPAPVKMKIQYGLNNMGGIILSVLQAAASRTLGMVATSFSVIIGLATAPILVFYLIKDSQSVNSTLCAPLPARMQPHMRAMLEIVNQTFGSYIRGQLFLGVVVGTILTIGLLLMGAPSPFFLGLVGGLTELVPIIGPWIGGAVAILVTLAVAPEKAIWVILLYVSVQVVENAVLVPRIQGFTLNMHPIFVIMVIVVASQLFGIWGVILGPPLAAMGKEMIKYLAREWNQEPSMGPELVPAAAMVHAAEPPDEDETTGE